MSNFEEEKILCPPAGSLLSVLLVLGYADAQLEVQGVLVLRIGAGLYAVSDSVWILYGRESRENAWLFSRCKFPMITFSP
jgi:hypothetical protein